MRSDKLGLACWARLTGGDHTGGDTGLTAVTPVSLACQQLSSTGASSQGKR